MIWVDFFCSFPDMVTSDEVVATAGSCFSGQDDKFLAFFIHSSWALADSKFIQKMRVYYC